MFKNNHLTIISRKKPLKKSKESFLNSQRLIWKWIDSGVLDFLPDKDGGVKNMEEEKELLEKVKKIKKSKRNRFLIFLFSAAPPRPRPVRPPPQLVLLRRVHPLRAIPALRCHQRRRQDRKVPGTGDTLLECQKCTVVFLTNSINREMPGVATARTSLPTCPTRRGAAC